jgi:WhiB family redox-sensing transcriptional regulator
MDPATFVPAHDRANLTEARAVCAGCPVTVECADEAHRTSALGVWGGADERERRAARRRSA